MFMRPSAPGPLRAAGLALAALLLAAPLKAETSGDPPPKKDWTAVAKEKLRGKTVTLGAGYVQGTFKLGQTDSALGRSQQTDNGKLNYLVDLSGSDRVLKVWPMRTGQFLLGWNLTASLGQFKADRQLMTSALRGQDMGTAVKGVYVGGAPSLFLRIGPLWEDHEIYCTFGFGVGAAALQYQGDALFGPAPGTYGVVASGVRPALFDKAYWQFQMGHWVLVFDAKYFLAHDKTYSQASFESYGLGLAYQIEF